MLNQINTLLTRIKTTNPLIINITNQVTVNFVANGLLSLGASPLMTHALEEIEELVNIANAVVINLGTLNENFITLCHKVCQVANRLDKPLILDPVGAGASWYRTQTCSDLLKCYTFSIIRGNASEIMALAGASQNTKGVDSTVGTHYSIDCAKGLALKHKLSVVVSGQIDAVVSQEQVQLFERGSPLMPLVTGSGCLLSAVIAAFHAVHQNSFEASSTAVVFYGVCGELAAKKSSGPGSFAVHFLDALSFLANPSDYPQNANSSII